MGKPNIPGIVPTLRGETSVLTGMARLAFANVLKPAENLNGELKYSCVLLFAPDDPTIPLLKKAAGNAIKAKWGDKVPSSLRNPVRDGNEKEWAGFPGHLYISPTSATRPGIVDQRAKPVDSPETIYSGCWVRADVNAFAYDNKGNKGASFGLNNLQVLGDDDAFTGRQKAESVFAPVVDVGSPFAENEQAEDDIFK
jgi:hypothetical protein